MDSYKSNISDEISREYARIREANKRKRQKITEEIYKKIPRVKEIDAQINEIGLHFASEVLENKDNPQKAVRQMQAQMDTLIAEKTRLLIGGNYSADAMKEIYTCAECRDRGYVDGRQCGCYLQKRNRLLQKYSNICMSDKNCFERFNPFLFSDKKDEKYGISPRENIESVYEIALAFADGKSGSPNNLLFYGNTGLGKTFTSDCIAKRYIENGKTVFYMSAPKMFSIFEDYKFGRDTSSEIQSSIAAVYDAGLLIIDDLGTEFKTAYSDSILFDIVNSRIIKEIPMIISTNLSIKDLKRAYSERISSRILGNFGLVLFFGEDIRLKDL